MSQSFSVPGLNDLAFLSGTGEMASLIRSHSWSATLLGDPSTWPQPLRTLVGVMLASVQPMEPRKSDVLLRRGLCARLG